MKLLHTSDWHLGAAERETPLYDDQKFFIDRICEIIKENAVDAVLLAGDIFDRAVASADGVRLYDYAMTRICGELSVPVLAIAGNHDSAQRLASCRELLETAGLHIVGSLEAKPKKVVLGDSEIYFLPWITEEKVKSLYPDESDEIKSLDGAYRTVTAKMRADFTPGMRHIVISHAFVTGAELSESDHAAQIGFASQVPASVFDGFDYAALGHIHKPQCVTDKIRYSGTPMPYSFGREEKQEKSVVIIDTASMEQRTVPLPLLHRRTTLTGTIEGLLCPQCESEIINGYVKLRVPDEYLGLEALNRLKGVYPHIIDAAGKAYEGEATSVTLSAQQFERLESDPVEVFRYFCIDQMNQPPDERLTELFKNAVTAAGEDEI